MLSIFKICANRRIIIKNTGHSFDAYFKRAVSPLIVLALLEGRDMYVYELSQAMKALSGNQLAVSVLYPVLHKLEEQGFVVVSRIENVKNRVRSYYAITDAGKLHLAELKTSYSQLTDAVEVILSKGEGEADGL